jgi:hypothetical protein
MHRKIATAFLLIVTGALSAGETADASRTEAAERERVRKKILSHTCSR